MTATQNDDPAVIAECSRRSIVWWAVAGFAAAVGILTLAVWTPADDPRHALCVTRRTLGVACAGCGMTRATAALVKGDLNAAFALHPLAPALFAQAVGGWIVWGVSVLRRRPAPRARTLLVWVGLNAVALLLVWLLRWVSGTLPA